MKKDLIKGFKAIKNNNNLEFVISISKFKSTFYRSLKVKNNKIFPLFKKYISTRTQDLSDLYFDNAQFTFGKSSIVFLLKKIIFQNSFERFFITET